MVWASQDGQFALSDGCSLVSEAVMILLSSKSWTCQAYLHLKTKRHLGAAATPNPVWTG
jgi:hypothetical protein